VFLHLMTSLIHHGHAEQAYLGAWVLGTWLRLRQGWLVSRWLDCLHMTKSVLRKRKRKH